MDAMDVGSAKNKEHLLGKAIGSKQIHLNREAMWVRNGKAIRAHTPPDTRHEAIGFNVCPAEVWSYFDLILPCYAPIPPF
jgi:hypothetical protein